MMVVYECFCTVLTYGIILSCFQCLVVNRLGTYVATPALPMDADTCGILHLAAGLFQDVFCIQRHYLCMFSLSGIVYGEA
jgi:hypothetical protein